MFCKGVIFVNDEPAFVDMALDTEDQKEAASSVPEPPLYPYSLCISFSEKELEKLDLDDDCDPGDMVVLLCAAKVTSVSKRNTADDTCCRVEMQIEQIAVVQDDDEQDQKPLGRTRPY